MNSFMMVFPNARMVCLESHAATARCTAVQSCLQSSQCGLLGTDSMRLRADTPEDRRTISARSAVRCRQMCHPEYDANLRVNHMITHQDSPVGGCLHVCVRMQ